GLQWVLGLCQPGGQIGIVRLQGGDAVLKRGDEGQEGGSGFGWDRVPEGWGDQRLSSHTLYYETSVQRVRPCDDSGSQRIPNSTRRTAYQLRLCRIVDPSLSSGPDRLLVSWSRTHQSCVRHARLPPPMSPP